MFIQQGEKKKKSTSSVPTAELLNRVELIDTAFLNNVVKRPVQYWVSVPISTDASPNISTSLMCHLGKLRMTDWKQKTSTNPDVHSSEDKDMCLPQQHSPKFLYFSTADQPFNLLRSELLSLTVMRTLQVLFSNYLESVGAH